MGRTPGKNSKTGKAVFERMRKEESCFPAGGTNFFVFRFSICGNLSKNTFYLYSHLELFINLYFSSDSIGNSR